jgi:copper(I)-binding protein
MSADTAARRGAPAARWRLALLALAALAAPAGAALAAPPRIAVEGAWVRGTVEGQTGTGAYLRLTSDADARLVGARTRSADRVEIHEMNSEGGRMTMRALPGVDLPAHATVALERGRHLMLIGLHGTLHAGDKVTLTLHCVDARGAPFDVEVTAPVRALNGATAG